LQPSLRGTSSSLGAIAPDLCYKCHCDKQVYQQIAGPHQICGPNGFNCTTCHDTHGTLRAETRKDLCLQCHDKHSPTMAWHSSTHNLNDVACVDCHNPHPNTAVQRVVNVSHTDVKRPKRLPMAVQEPEACYKCHPKIYGMNQLPSHHPIREGKIVCSDCHDAHGQSEGNLKEPKVNMVCYKCHADKQGPFAYQHAPVEENCAICHEPHGSVTNNLLRQPAMFLCLRCHSGHRGTHGAGARNDIDRKPWMQQAFYSNSCNSCHNQVHGSDLKEGNGAPFSR
jgi:DmsE family decaheme c-type cytochrome